MSAIRLKNVRKAYGAVEVIKGVDLDIGDGEFVVFVGPSGCGKSTMLRLIAGLEEASSGDIFIRDRNVTRVGPDKRGLAMVFQSYALYPHLTVRENMSFSLSMAGADKKAQAEAVAVSAGILQLEPLLDRKPKELSGGQRQRVAIGRAIVREPQAFLFDEPLSNLDAALRVQMRVELARLHKRLGKTMIYVTHDQVEAMTLADRIVVFNAGVIQQQGEPLELYHRPSNLFVATFIGSPKMNVIDFSSTGEDERRMERMRRLIPQGAGETGYLGIRPEHIRIAAPDAAPIRGVVGVAEHLGSDSFIYVDIDGLETPVNVRVAGGARIAAGEAVGLEFDRANLHVFDRKGERLAA
jgi:multiple sugar transport system ATP-binding protein